MKQNYLFYTVFLIILGCAQISKCLRNARNITSSNPSKRTASEEPKIIGGYKANLKDAYFVASIRLKLADKLFGKGHMCGGSLISQKLVLSAAHCFVDLQSEDQKKIRRPNEISVVFGSLNRAKIEDSTLVFDVQELVLHEKSEFAGVNYRNDIALASLVGRVEETHSYIQPIKLNGHQVGTGTSCTILGWGQTQYYSSEESSVLLKAGIYVLDRKKCEENLMIELDPGTFCAGHWDGKKDACFGDSGGPMICSNLLVGIVSTGVLCGQPNLPGLYTDVAAHRLWINRVANKISSEGSFVSSKCDYALIILSIFLKTVLYFILLK